MVIAQRRALGQWFTAAPVAQLALAALGPLDPASRVLDPTCGDGAFLAAAHAAGLRDLVGVDIDREAAERARARVPADIVDGDFLDPALALGTFDLVIGNPPFVRAGRIDPALKRARAAVLQADWPELDRAKLDVVARLADTSATYVLRALRACKPGGKLALVLPQALVDTDAAAPLWDLVQAVADVRALIVAPTERWFVEAWVNSLLLVAERRADLAEQRADIAERRVDVAERRVDIAERRVDIAERRVDIAERRVDIAERRVDIAERRAEIAERRVDVAARRADSAERRAGEIAPTRVMRLRVPTARAAEEVGLDGIARHADERLVDASPAGGASAWGPALRAPRVWWQLRDRAGDLLVPLRELADVRRGMTTGANDVFYLSRRDAKAIGMEPEYLSPVVRSPFNGSPASIAIDPDESPLVAITLPPDPRVLRRAPHIRAWLDRHAEVAQRSSIARRDPWWSLHVDPARLFFAKAYGPRFVQRLCDVPILGDQRVYALHPKPGVDVVALAAVLNALPTALALESLGRASLGYGAVEWTVHDAMELPVLDVRRLDGRTRDELAALLAAFGRRPIEHVRHERDRPDRAALDRCVLGLACVGEMADEMWSALLASVALRDRYLLPGV